MRGKAVLHIILRNDALVGHSLLIQEVRGNCLLEKRIPDVFLVPQHRGFDTSSCLHPHPINERVKRGEGG